MPVPAHLRNVILNIQDYSDVSLTSIFERRRNGDYVYAVTFRGAYADWPGLIWVPEADVSQALRAEFRRTWDRETRTADVVLNPRQDGVASFGHRILRMSRNGRFVLSLTMTFGGRTYQGEVFIPRDDEAFELETREPRMVEFMSSPRIGKQVNVRVWDVQGRPIEYQGQVKISKADRVGNRLVVGFAMGGGQNKICLQGEVDDDEMGGFSGRMGVVNEDWE